MYTYTRESGTRKRVDLVIMARENLSFLPWLSTPAASRNSYRSRFHFLAPTPVVNLPTANNADTTLITSSALLGRAYYYSPADSPPSTYVRSIRRFLFPPPRETTPSFLRRNARIPPFLYSFIRDAYVRGRKQNLVADPATSTRLRNFSSSGLARIILPGGRNKAELHRRWERVRERERGRESSVHQVEIAAHPRGNRQVSLAYWQSDSQPVRIREFHPRVVGVIHDRWTVQTFFSFLFFFFYHRSVPLTWKFWERRVVHRFRRNIYGSVYTGTMRDFSSSYKQFSSNFFPPRFKRDAQPGVALKLEPPAFPLFQRWKPFCAFVFARRTRKWNTFARGGMEN